MPILPPAAGVAPAVATRLPAVAELCAKHRVRRLALFGSGTTARFDARRGSDLDFLAEFEPMPPREHADAYFGLMEDLQRLLGVPVDLVERGAIRNPYFEEAVRNTQVVLFEAA
jgi:predicted nucleotidyltransferase